MNLILLLICVGVLYLFTCLYFAEEFLELFEDLGAFFLEDGHIPPYLEQSFEYVSVLLLLLPLIAPVNMLIIIYLCRLKRMISDKGYSNYRDYKIFQKEEREKQTLEFYKKYNIAIPQLKDL